MSFVPLNYNQYAAQALWGGFSSSGSSSLLSIIKSNMLEKANSLNKNLISRYESYSSELTNKISYLDNLKSQLANLSTKAQNLTGLKNRVNSNINLSQGSSSLITITNDFIIKGQAAQPAGVISNDTSAINVGNYEGTFEAGDYAINITASDASGIIPSAQAIGSLNTSMTFAKSQLGGQPIFHIAGYNMPQSGEEDVTVSIGENKYSINISNHTTVNDFLAQLQALPEIMYTNISSDGKVTIQIAQDFRNLDLSFSSSNKSGGSTIDILGLNTLSYYSGYYRSYVNIQEDSSGNYYYYNLWRLDLYQDAEILINKESFDVKQSWSIKDLSDAINNLNSVDSYFDYNYNKLYINRTDGIFSYIDINFDSEPSSNVSSFLSILGFIKQEVNGDFVLNKDVQYFPDVTCVDVSVTKGGKSYDVTNIFKSDVVDESDEVIGARYTATVINRSTDDSNNILGSFDMEINKLGEYTITVNEATAATPDMVIEDLSGVTNYIETIGKSVILSSDNYTLRIQKISDTQMDIMGWDKNGNVIETQTISKNASDNKFYYTIAQYDENGDKKGSVTFEVKNDDNFKIGDIRETNIKIEATTSEGGSLEGIDEVINSINEQIDENNKKIINEFINAYNDVAKEVSKINKLSSTSTSYSDKLAINELMKSFNNIINQVDTTYGSTIGLTFSYDSNLNTSVLKLDTDKFLSALDTNTETVTNYLSKISEKITSSVDAFVKSKFASIYSSSNSKLDEYNNKISTLKSQNDELMAKLEADYKIIEQLFNRSSNQYSELFSALS